MRLHRIEAEGDRQAFQHFVLHRAVYNYFDWCDSPACRRACPLSWKEAFPSVPWYDFPPHIAKSHAKWFVDLETSIANKVMTQIAEQDPCIRLRLCLNQTADPKFRIVVRNDRKVQRRQARLRKFQCWQELVSKMNVCDPTTEDRTHVMIVSRAARQRESSQELGYDSDSSADLVVNVRGDLLCAYNNDIYRTLSGMIGSRLASRMLYYKLYIKSIISGPAIWKPKRNVVGFSRLYEPTVMSSSSDED